MRRLLTLVCLLCLAVPAGISISGCTRNPGANYCNGLGYGPKITDVAEITLGPATTGISIAFGQTQQLSFPVATTCKGTTASVNGYVYGSSNYQLVDISPTGLACAGTWNRNTGGGIANYTICSQPNPLPSTCIPSGSKNCLPYGKAFVSASASGVTSNQVTIFVHPQVTSVNLALENSAGSPVPSQCYSQNAQAQLDAQAYYNVGGQQILLCAPGSSSVPDCTAAIGPLSYAVGTGSIASINTTTNVITALMPGTTAITASVAGSGSSAGYFSVCPPASISLTLNGNVSGTITQGVQQNLVTTVTDTKGVAITGLSLDYQSTNPEEITVGSGGAVTAQFPGVASVYAVCQPSSCNPAPINQIGLYGNGLPISSNPVAITAPGTSSTFAWYGAPGQSRYIVPVDLLTNSVGTPVRLPYVPNSMATDQIGADLYLGSDRELMTFGLGNGVLTGQDGSVPGVVLAVAPGNTQQLIYDQKRNLFYIYTGGSVSTTFGGLGAAAAWTPDSKTLYIVDSAALNSTPANIQAGITGHTDTLYVYNANTGWTTEALPCSVQSRTCPNPSTGAQNLAITIPSVGAYIGGSPTTAHTWCPWGTVGDYTSMLFYPQGPAPDNSVAVQTDVLAATTDGKHILGAALASNGPQLVDIGISIPATESSSDILLPDACPATSTQLSPLVITDTLNTPLALSNVNAASFNQVVASTVPITSSSATTQASGLAFITYTPSDANATGAQLPWYVPASSGAGTVGYITLTGSKVAAPLAGAFSPDNTKFFVSTQGDNLVHYIDVNTLTDTQQINLQLPACVAGVDDGCQLTNTSTTATVPATKIVVKPHAIT